MYTGKDGGGGIFPDSSTYKRKQIRYYLKKQTDKLITGGKQKLIIIGLSTKLNLYFYGLYKKPTDNLQL